MELWIMESVIYSERLDKNLLTNILKCMFTLFHKLCLKLILKYILRDTLNVRNQFLCFVKFVS